jgi:hypothetical protein
MIILHLGFLIEVIFLEREPNSDSLDERVLEART